MEKPKEIEKKIENIIENTLNAPACKSKTNMAKAGRAVEEILALPLAGVYVAQVNGELSCRQREMTIGEALAVLPEIFRLTPPGFIRRLS